MQATATTKRFGFGRFGGSVTAAGMAAAFVVGIMTGIAGQAVIDDTTGSTGASPAGSRPKAHYSAGQGEGLVVGNIAIDAALKAYHAEGMGEGWLAGNAALSVLPVSHSTLGQGEGILGGNAGREVLAVPVVAYEDAGMGEGWLAQGRPQSTLQAHATDGQGEGWVGNGRP